MVKCGMSRRFFIVPWFYLGVLLIGDMSLGGAQTPQERIQELEAELRAQPNEVKNLVALGRLYAEVGRIRDGLDVLERATAIDPKNPAALAWLGNLQVRMTQTTDDPGERLRWMKKGTKTMDEAVEQFPEAAVVYIIRGISGVYTPDSFRRHVLSIQDFNKVLELKARNSAAVPDEQMPLVYLDLGLAYKKNNQKAEAKATWEKGRQLYPHAKEATLLEKELINL